MRPVSMKFMSVLALAFALFAGDAQAGLFDSGNLTPSKTASSASSDGVQAGKLTVSNARVSARKEGLDIYFSIKNTDPVDEKLSGGESAWKNSGLVQVTKDASGKETEGPLNASIAAGKTTDFNDGSTWLRLKGAEKPKDSDVVPLSLSFRRMPNALLKISGKSGSSGGFFN